MPALYLLIGLPGSGKTTWWDNTSLTATARRRILNRVPPGRERVAGPFDVPEEELRRRLRERKAAGGKRISDRLLADMRASWAPLEPGEVDRVEVVRPPDMSAPRTHSA